jgi:hypothetical protein
MGKRDKEIVYDPEEQRAFLKKFYKSKGEKKRLQKKKQERFKRKQKKRNDSEQSSERAPPSAPEPLCLAPEFTTESIEEIDNQHNAVVTVMTKKLKYN